jgi:hypothetical protein
MHNRKLLILKISRVLEQTSNEGNTLNRVGLAFWMSPESLAKQVYSKKSDMWMFGMLGTEMRFSQTNSGDT